MRDRFAVTREALLQPLQAVCRTLHSLPSTSDQQYLVELKLDLEKALHRLVRRTAAVNIRQEAGTFTPLQRKLKPTVDGKTDLTVPIVALSQRRFPANTRNKPYGERKNCSV